jgi:hypothetical protein
VFDTFVKVAKSIKGGVLDDSYRRDWLIFQILPLVRHNDMDSFSALIRSCLSGVSIGVLKGLQDLYNPSTVLGSAFHFTTNPFLYVLDEAQVAGQQYMGAFADSEVKVSRPVLRPLIKCFSSSHPYSVKIIVSRTGFSLDLFETVVSSGVSKQPRWESVHTTGDFSKPDIQLNYISRYLPPLFLQSQSGTHLKTRVYDWLRGRYVVNKNRAIAHVFYPGIGLLPASWKN